MRIERRTIATTSILVVAAWGLMALKLAGWAPVAKWSWWTVWAPLWGPWLATAIAAVALLAGMAGDRAMRWLEEWARA